MPGKANPAAAAAETPLEAWEQTNQEEEPLPKCCRLGTRCWAAAEEGTCSVGRTIRLMSTMLEELAGDDRRERAQSESSMLWVSLLSENILLLLLLLSGGGGGGATAFRRGWHTGISRVAAALVLKLIWSPSCRKGKRRPSLEYDDVEPAKFCLLLRTWWV
jgi:hypothetical protein